MPSSGTFCANEQVGGSIGQQVKHRVIRGADRAAQVGLGGPPPIKLGQAASGSYHVARFHVSSCLIPV